MLTLTGIIRAAAMVGGGVDKKTGEIRTKRPVLQIEGLDNRGLVQIYTLTVPSLDTYQGKVGQEISVPIRAWAAGSPVNFMYEEKQ